jgi:tRNA 2-thiouridine synthesizing protein B
MSTLHTVNKSAYERNSLNGCLEHTLPGDVVLLIEDGVLSALKGGSIAPTLTAAKANCKIYALGPDLAARGIVAGQVMDGIETVDYAGFVDLAAGADRVCAWL